MNKQDLIDESIKQDVWEEETERMICAPPMCSKCAIELIAHGLCGACSGNTK